MEIIQHFLEKHPCYQFNLSASDKDKYATFQNNGPRGVILYLFQESSIDYYIRERNQEKYTNCPHCILKVDSEEIVQLLPWNYRGWHSPFPYNDTHIGVLVPLPEGTQLIKGNFQIEDLERAKKSINKIFRLLLFLLKFLSKQYQMNFLEENTILTYLDVYNKVISRQDSDLFAVWALVDKKYSLGYLRQELNILISESGKDDVKKTVEPQPLDEKVKENESLPAVEDKKFSSYKIKVKVDSLNYRDGPGIDHKIVGAIKDKGVYLIVDEKRGWGQINRLGWIHLMHTQKI